MSTMFGNMTNEGLEESQDRLGGFVLFDTDIYPAHIKMAYATQSAQGARAIFFEFDLGAGQTYRETIYFTNKKGENYYITENKKKAPLPGFTTVDELCMLATEDPLALQETEDKTVKVYDADAKKELPKSVPVLVNLLGKEVSLGLVKFIEDKTVKNQTTGEYEPNGETVERNRIEKTFHTATKLTVPEARNGKEEGEFWGKWQERNKGVIQDRRKNKSGAVGSSGVGRPQAGAPQSATQAGGAAPARKSLFGNKG